MNDSTKKIIKICAVVVPVLAVAVFVGGRYFSDAEVKAGEKPTVTPTEQVAPTTPQVTVEAVETIAPTVEATVEPTVEVTPQPTQTPAPVATPKPKTQPTPKPTPVETPKPQPTEAPQQTKEVAPLDKPDSSQPKDEGKKEGQVFVPGFGYIDGEPGGQGEVVEMNPNGNIIGH